MRRALARAAEMQSARVNSYTQLRDGVVLESTQVSASACTENAHVVGEILGQDTLTLRVAVSVRSDGTCRQPCSQATVNRVVIAGFALEHPTQILPTEKSWLTNWTPVELARLIDKRRQILATADALVFPYASPASAPVPHLGPMDKETPFASLARRHRAQYVVAGVYRDFGLSGGGLFGKKRSIEVEAFIHDGINGSVLDRKVLAKVAEGQVDLRSQPPVGTAEFNASDLGRAWGEVARELADWITEKAACLPFVTRVLKTEGSKIYLDAGADSGLSAGDTLVLHTWRQPPDPVRGEDGRILGQEKFSRTVASIRYAYPAFSVAELDVRRGMTVVPGDLFYAR